MIGVIIGIRLYFYSLSEKKKQTYLMEQTLYSFEKIYQLAQGDTKMKFDLNEILSGHQPTTNPHQATAMSQDIANGLKNLTSVGAALAGNLGRIAVNTGIQQQTLELGNLNTQVAKFAESLADKTVNEGIQNANFALGKDQQQTITEPVVSSEVEIANSEKHFVEKSCHSVEDIHFKEEVDFSINDVRSFVRENDSIKHVFHISSPGKSISGDFDIKRKDVNGIINTLLAKEKQGKLADMKNGEKVLKFLQEEYNPVE